MQLVRFIIIGVFLILGGKSFCQNQVYVLIDEQDTLIERRVIRDNESDKYISYYFYIEEYLNEKDSLLRFYNGILPAGFCEYINFDTYDKGQDISCSYFYDKTVLERRDLINYDFRNTTIYALEEYIGDTYILRKLYLNACE